MSDNIKILIVEDEPIIAEDIFSYLEDRGYSCLEPTYSLYQARKALDSLNPDFCVLDINLGKADDGLVLGKELNEIRKIPFLYLTSFQDDATINKAKLTQPQAYITKPVSYPTLYSSVEIGLYNYSIQNFPSLERINNSLLSKMTEREYEILNDLYSGKNNKQIAEQRCISINTAKTHIKNIYDKLDVHSRSELIITMMS